MAGNRAWLAIFHRPRDRARVCSPRNGGFLVCSRRERERGSRAPSANSGRNFGRGHLSAATLEESLTTFQFGAMRRARNTQWVHSAGGAVPISLCGAESCPIAEKTDQRSRRTRERCGRYHYTGWCRNAIFLFSRKPAISSQLPLSQTRSFVRSRRSNEIAASGRLRNKIQCKRFIRPSLARPPAPSLPCFIRYQIDNWPFSLLTERRRRFWDDFAQRFLQCTECKGQSSSSKLVKQSWSDFVTRDFPSSCYTNDQIIRNEHGAWLHQCNRREMLFKCAKYTVGKNEGMRTC